MNSTEGVRIDSGFGLAEALSVGKGDVVSLVGAGGKTTVLYALGTELHRQGLTVVTTCTTHTQLPSMANTAPPLVVTSEEENWLTTVKSRLSRYGSVTVVGRRVRQDKLEGIDPVMIDPLRSLSDAVVIEADGARSRSLKTPAEHEPVVAEETTLVVILVGLDVLGKPLDPEHVHRAEILSRLSGWPLGSPVTEEVIAAAVAAGYLPRLPKNSRKLALLNKASDDRLPQAESLGELLLSVGIPEVVFGEARKPHDLFYRMRPAER